MIIHLENRLYTVQILQPPPKQPSTFLQKQHQITVEV